MMGRKAKQIEGQLPMFRPDSPWRPPSLSDMPSWEGAARVGVDIETKDPQLKQLGPGVRRKGCYIVGVSFAIEDGPKHYLPIRHAGGDNLDPEKVIQYLKDQAKYYTGAICGANIGYDLDWLAEEGVVFRQATFKDVQVAEPLIDENQFSYNLETLSEKYGFTGKNEALLREAATAFGLDPKKDLWQLPGRYVGPYAEDDADLPLQILRKQERIIDDNDLWGIYDLECQVTPVLVKMRRRGIRIDFDQLDKVEDFTMEKETEFLQVIYDKTGVRIKLDEINKTKLVVRACDVAQIPYGRTDPSKKFPDGQPSVKREFLEPNADHPVVNAILEARSYNKIRNTFVESVRKHAVNGRIHTTFNQLRRQDDNSDNVKGVGPGRLSCVPKVGSEILTRRGWLAWDELCIGEDVMGYNILTNQYQWTRLKAVHDSGIAPIGMIKVTRGHSNPGPNSLPQGLMCTGEHRWVISHPKLSGFIKAEDNVRLFRKLIMPKREMPENSVSLLSDDQAFVLGWYLTDGWLRKCPKMINHAMCVGVVKQSSITQLEKRIAAYKLQEYTTHHTYLRKLSKNDHKRRVHYFYFKANYFEPIYSAIQGKDPAEVIMSLSASARQAMMSAMLEGDGSRRRGAQRYDRFGALEHHNKQTWEFFTTLAAACGQPYGVSRTITRHGNPFLNFQLLEDDVVDNKDHRWIVSGEVDTWCPETELGTWVMRQGKRICITGNSCDPNLQQQPSRHEILGKMWRSIYLPDEGGRWASLDYCFSADTEVLTEHGFVPFPELSRDIKVAQYWPNGSVTYAIPKAYQTVPYSGEMYHIHGQRQVDLLVSPNHRCALVSPDGKLSFQRADEPWSGGKLVPQNGVASGTLSLPDSVVQQAAIIQADGSYRIHHYRVFAGKDRKIERLRGILGRDRNYVCKTKAAGHAFKLNLNPLIVPGKTKLFNRKKLLALTLRLRTLFLNELLHWDGSQSSSTYYTTVKENAEIVQEVACLTGFRSNLSCKPQPGCRKDLYIVTLNRKAGTYVKTIEKSTKSYDGTIYCVTMPASTVIVRRNGRVAVCGQSQQEPRLFVHFAHIAGCPGTQEAVDKFHAGYDWHDMTTEMAFGVTRDGDLPKFLKLRKKAKAVFLGLTYGMGQAKMCKSCGFATEIVNIRGADREVAGPEGRAFLAEFNRKVPFLQDIKQRAERVAWNRRYIRTLLGRHIHYPPGLNMERKALNNLIQGCIRGDTYIVDKNRGHQQIKNIVGPVTLWDGYRWAKAIVVPTGDKEEIKLTFKNGQTIYCSDNHRFLFVNTIGSEIWKKVSELKPRDRIRRSEEVPTFSGEVKLPYFDRKAKNAHDYSFENVKDPHHRGVLLGRIASDGNYSGHVVSFIVANHEQQITNLLFRDLPFKLGNPQHRRSVTHYPIWSKSLNEQCQYLNLKNKIHPYIFSNKELLRGFLCGFFDGDGGVSISRANTKVQKDYSTIHLCFGKRHNKTQLPGDIQKALTIFGISSRLKYYKESVRIRIKNEDNYTFLQEIGFLNIEKTKKVFPNKKKKLAVGAVEIIQSIEKTGKIIPMYDVINSETEQFSLHGLISHNSAADQTKLAMVLLDKENFKIQLQIHDEIDITVYDEKTAKDMAEIMTTCVPLVVPSKVDVEIGNNWGDSME